MESPQTFVKISDHILWIESIVWPNQRENDSTEIPTNGNESTTTAEEPPHSFSENHGLTTPEISSSRRMKTINSDGTLTSDGINDELHEIHKFLNVNTILIGIILFLVLCILWIMWNDGVCIKAAPPVEYRMSTQV